MTRLAQRLAAMRMNYAHRGQQECKAATQAIEGLEDVAKKLHMEDLQDLAQTIAQAIDQAHRQLQRELGDAKGAYNRAL